MAMDVTSNQQVQQTSVAGSMAKTGAISGGVAAGVVVGGGYLGEKMLIKTYPQVMDEFRQAIKQIPKELADNKCIRDEFANSIKLLRKIKREGVQWKTIMKSGAKAAVCVGLVGAAIAGIVGLAKSSGKNKA